MDLTYRGTRRRSRSEIDSSHTVVSVIGTVEQQVPMLGSTGPVPGVVTMGVVRRCPMITHDQSSVQLVSNSHASLNSFEKDLKRFQYFLVQFRMSGEEQVVIHEERAFVHIQHHT